MRSVIGTLQTGMYIVEMAEDPGKYATVKKDRTKFALTNDYRVEEAAKWFIERVGNDIYRVTAKNFNASFAHNPRQRTVDVGELEAPADWIIKEADIPGEYCGSPVGHSDLYVYVERAENHIDVKLGAEHRMTRVHLYYADE